MTRALLCLAFALPLCGCPNQGGAGAGSSSPAVDPYADDDPSPAPFEDWYPEDIAPPEGTQYPCPLAEHPLPEELPGIPNKDRQFINHVYSQILACTQAKLLLSSPAVQLLRWRPRASSSPPTPPSPWACPSATGSTPRRSPSPGSRPPWR